MLDSAQSPSDNAAEKPVYVPREWIQKHLRILTEERGVQSLTFTEIQHLLMDIVDILRELAIPVRLLILKARRHRVSTWTQAVMFEDTVHHSGVRTLIVAHEEEAKSTIFDMARTFYDYLPLEERPLTRYSSKKELAFENPDAKTRHVNPGLKSAYRVAIAKRKDVGRSQLIHNAHFSEVDFWGKPAKQIFQALLPTIPDVPRTMIVMETTARSEGYGGEFFKRWQEAQKFVKETVREEPLRWDREAQRMLVNRSFFTRIAELTERGATPFIPLFFPWFMNPNYEIEPREPLGDLTEEEQGLRDTYGLSDAKLNFRRRRIEHTYRGDVTSFQEEYPKDDRECWYAGMTSRFNVAQLAAYESEIEGYQPLAVGNLRLSGGDVRFEADMNGYLTLYAPPKEGHKYVIGGDASAGVKGGDYSVLTVEDAKTGEHMAEWYGLIDPDLLGVEAYKLATFYNRALVGIENERHGITALRRLWDGVERLGIPPYHNVMLAETHDTDDEVQTHELGWSTNRVTRDVLLDDLAEIIRERAKAYKSIGFIRECFSFVRDAGGKFKASPGCYDDRVMAYGVAEQARKYYWRAKAF